MIFELGFMIWLALKEITIYDLLLTQKTNTIYELRSTRCYLANKE
jgi:hypothetical protein